MIKPKYNDSQIMAILKKAETGVLLVNIRREHCIGSATFYKRRPKYGCMDLPMITKLKKLEAENTRLKKMYADERLKAEILREVLEKK